uniref:Uncharacterized protein n=1 Tax=Oryza brachyantha TaxID=4533 RepID=J3KZJ1_ORYBR
MWVLGGVEPTCKWKEMKGLESDPRLGYVRAAARLVVASTGGWWRYNDGRPRATRSGGYEKNGGLCAAGSREGGGAKARRVVTAGGPNNRGHRRRHVLQKPGVGSGRQRSWAQ